MMCLKFLSYGRFILLKDEISVNFKIKAFKVKLIFKTIIFFRAKTYKKEIF